MALKPGTTYPAQTVSGDPNYPHGKARNDIVPGDYTGSPLEQAWVNDVWGFLQAILQTGNTAPSGVPDNANTSQYIQALRNIFVDRGPYTVNVPLAGLVDESGLDQFAWRRDGVANQTYWEQQSLGESSLGAKIIFPLSIPVGLNLVSVRMYSKGAGHSFIPVTLPKMQVQWQTEYAGRILLGTQSVVAADLAAYEAGVTTTLSFSPYIEQTAGRNFHVELTGESGSGAILTGWRVYNLEMTLSNESL